MTLAPLRPPGIRPGHHRPIGSTTTWRFQWDAGEPLPQLGDVLEQVSASGADDADYVRRAYLVVGFLEGRERGRFRLVLERLEWPGVAEPGRRRHGFYNLPRRA